MVNPISGGGKQNATGSNNGAGKTREGAVHIGAVEPAEIGGIQRGEAQEEPASVESRGDKHGNIGDQSKRTDDEKIIRELRSQSQFSGTASQVEHYLFDHPRMVSPLFKGRLASLYIDPEGIVNVIKPHTHDIIARSVLRKSTDLDVPTETTGDDEWIQIFQRNTGIIHAQSFEDGSGVTIDLTRPPTRDQIRAIHDLHKASGDRFSAYINRNGKSVGHSNTFQGMVKIIRDNAGSLDG